MYSDLEQKWLEIGLVDVGSLAPDIRLDLRYTRADNFSGIQLYTDFNHAFLRAEAAEMLKQAAIWLRQHHPEFRLLLWDAFRPHSVQYILYEAVKNGPYAAFVAHPERGSMHNYGMAVDISLCDAQGKPVDMGSDFDEFGETAMPSEEESLLEKGILNPNQLESRRLLRQAMTEAGFKGIDSEWWHFEAGDKEKIRRLYSML